jgi:hypothetical protein
MRVIANGIRKRRTLMSEKKEPLFTWYEKLCIYFVALVVIAFLIIIGDVKAEREKDQKIQECVQFLEDNK